MPIEIRRHKKRGVPSLNMASMPDLIFTVLFFFMIVTHMRTETPAVRVETPSGHGLAKPSRRHASINLYVGKDAHGAMRYQVGKSVVTLGQIAPLITKLREHSSDDNGEFTVNLRADRHTPMGVLNEVKNEVRKSGATAIRYCATETPTDQ